MLQRELPDDIEILDQLDPTWPDNDEGMDSTEVF